MNRPLALGVASLLLASGWLGASILDAPRAAAYCRTATGDAGAECVPSKSGDHGTPLQWSQQCVGFNIQQDASQQVTYHDADQVLRAAFSTWMNAPCRGGPPSIKIEDLGSVQCGQVEYNDNAGNANILVFRDTVWPHATDRGSVEAIALTTVTFDPNTGEIFDADIEVNSGQNKLSLTDTGVQVDLLSVLTHETGHFLGLAHSDSLDATMFYQYAMGTTTIRQLTHDDADAICAAYPPGRTTKPTCDPIPRHGFAPECASDQQEGKCSAVAPGAGAGSGLAWVALAALAAAARRRRR